MPWPQRKHVPSVQLGGLTSRCALSLASLGDSSRVVGGAGFAAGVELPHAVANSANVMASAWTADRNMVRNLQGDCTMRNRNCHRRNANCAAYLGGLGGVLPLPLDSWRRQRLGN